MTLSKNTNPIFSGRNNQEVQKGIIPNKARAEELATAQFNATKKELSASESRGEYFSKAASFFCCDFYRCLFLSLK